MTRPSDVATSAEALDQWVAIHDCQDIVVRFMGCFDMRSWRAMESHVTQDIVWQRPDQTITGLMQLREKLQATPETVRVRHVITNFQAARLSETRMVMESYFTVFRVTAQTSSPTETLPCEGPVSMGRYRDELVKLSAGWRIARKQTFVDFRRTQP